MQIAASIQPKVARVYIVADGGRRLYGLRVSANPDDTTLLDTIETIYDKADYR